MTIETEAYPVPADLRLGGRTPKNPLMDQAELYVDGMGTQMGSFLRIPEMGLNLRIRNSRPRRPLSSRPGDIIGSDKLAVSHLMRNNQVTI